MKQFYNIEITLESGIAFNAHVNREDIEIFKEWIDTVPGIKEHTTDKIVVTRGARSKKMTKISQARIAAGLKQRELAERLGVSISQEQYWEYGRYKLKTATLKKLGEALGVDWTTLVEDE